jgi:hypothetical protein
MTFYGDMTDVVTELLGEFGADVVITREIYEEIDPVTGDVLIEAESTEYTAKGIMKKYPENVINGSRITVSDRQLMLETSIIEPLITDKITINGQEWPIMEIESINPAGTALLYTIRVRR